MLLAVAVTMHVLLRKREVSSAAAWIGLAWFAPVMGSVSYVLFGINRVQRRARRLKDGGGPRPDAPDEGDARPLQRGIAGITGRAMAPGTALAVYQDGDEAYPPMLAAIAGARQSVGMVSFIFHDDVWGGRFIAALAAAHDRGVAVRVLVDGIGGGWLRSAAYHRLRARGVPAARFLHSSGPWLMPFLNLRCHKKVLVVDGAVAFTGGMNIADANVKAMRSPAPVQDTHFRVEGPVVRQLSEAFAGDWSFATNEDLGGDLWFPPLHSHGGAPARVIDSGPDDDIEKIEFAVLQAVACARTRISVMTPYFLPDERLATALALAVQRGVSVDVVVPETSDHVLIDWALRANLGPMLKEEVRVWRCPPPFRHSKAMLVDDDWVLVGSCNWDIRSFRLNFELCLEFYDKAVSVELDRFMLTCRGREWTLAELDARPLPGRLRDACARLMLPYL